MSRTDETYLRLLRARYRRVGKKERGAILDELVKTTVYLRKCATALLNGRRQQSQGPIKPPRRALYGPEEADTPLILWPLFDHINSRRLRNPLDAELQGWYESGFLPVSSQCYEKLKRTSPATADRLLAGRRRRPGNRRGFTKPGRLLKHQIPFRTWADRTEDRPGFSETDLVAIAASGPSAELTTRGHSVSRM